MTQNLPEDEEKINDHCLPTDKCCTSLVRLCACYLVSINSCKSNNKQS